MAGKNIRATGQDRDRSIGGQSRPDLAQTPAA